MYVAIYALRKVKGFVQGCGGRTEVEIIEDRFDPLDLGLSEIGRSSSEIEKDFEFLEKQLRPLVCSYPDFSNVDKRYFSGVLRVFERKLKQYRDQKVRAYEKEEKRQRKEWEEEQSELNAQNRDGD
jgi:hypothetical protein